MDRRENLYRDGYVGSHEIQRLSDILQKEVLRLGIMLVEEDILLPRLNVSLHFFPAYPKQRIVPSQDSLRK